MSIVIKWELRKAIYRPRVDRPTLNITKGDEVPVKVHGCYPVADGDDVSPYFVAELEDGRCTYAAPEDIQFVYEEDED